MRAHPLLLLAFVGCGDASRDRSVATIRDSAGVAIVENHSLDRVPKVTVPDTSLVIEIGGATDDTTQQLFHVEGAHVLSDGRIVVANRGSHELRYYGANGVFLKASGREGDGPGEFRYLSWTIRCGSDSVVAYDIAHRAATVFDPAGVFVRSFEFQAPDGQPIYGPPSCWDGTFSVLAWAARTGRPPPGYHRPEQPIFATDRNGNRLGFVDTIPGTERWGHDRGSQPALFGRTPVHTVGPGGVVVGSADAPEIRVHALPGPLVRVIRWAGTRRAVTAGHIARARDSALAAARSENARRRSERQFAEAVFPDSFPPYDRALVDAGGRIWLRDYRVPGDTTTTWTVFGDDGGAIERVTLPTGLWLFEVGADYLIGRWKDALDNEYVRVYRDRGRRQWVLGHRS